MVEYLRMLEEPSQPVAKTVVSCSCSSSVRSKWSSYLVPFKTIIKMHGCDDNDVMVFKLVEALRGSVLEYYNSLSAEIRGQFSTICTLFQRRFGRQEPPATTRSNLKTINQRVDEPLPEFVSWS